MGKKRSSGNGGGGGDSGEPVVVVAMEFVLKVAMHCRCRGCTDKVRGAIRDITLAPGVEAADSSAAESHGEVRLLATADPERLRRRLRKATGKKVDLLLPREPAGKDQGKKAGDPLEDPAFQALLANLQLQAQAQAPARQQYAGGHGAAAAAWAANQQQQQHLMGLSLGLGGGGWNGAAAGGYGEAYPWLSSSASSYYPAAPAPSWGAYAYPPPAPAPAHGLAHLGYYGGGGGGCAPAWHGY